MKLLAHELQEGSDEDRKAISRLASLLASIPTPEQPVKRGVNKATLPREADLKIPKGWQDTWDEGADPYPESTSFPGGARKVEWAVEITLKNKTSLAAEDVFRESEFGFHNVESKPGGGSASIVGVGLRPNFLRDLEQDRRVKSYRYKIVAYW